MKDRVFRFTPLGKVDFTIKDIYGEHLEGEKSEEYHSALNSYRNIKSIQVIMKVFLYAGIVTSVAATFGLDGLLLIEQIASYVGTSALFVFYAVVSYITMIRREYYHLQREILVSEVS